MEKLKSLLFRSPEGRILGLGAVLGLLFSGILFYYFRTTPARALALTAAFSIHLAGGRAMGIYTCLANDFSLRETFFYNLLFEAIIVFVCYPVIVWTTANLIGWKYLKIAAKNVETQAHRYQSGVQKYGWVGLFFFSIIPLPMAGPMMGTVIGYFLGVAVWVNMLAAMAGTSVALMAWTFLFNVILDHSHGIKIAKYAVAAILLFLIVYHFKKIRRFFTEEIPA